MSTEFFKNFIQSFMSSLWYLLILCSKNCFHWIIRLLSLIGKYFNAVTNGYAWFIFHSIHSNMSVVTLVEMSFFSCTTSRQVYFTLGGIIWKFGSQLSNQSHFESPGFVTFWIFLLIEGRFFKDSVSRISMWLWVMDSLPGHMNRTSNYHNTLLVYIG